MAERLRRLVGWLGAVLGAAWSWFKGFVATAWRRLTMQWRLLQVGQDVRLQARQRREVFETIGKMVYLLYKRNLVRNPDLLVECEKVLDLDTRLDELNDKADRIRAARPEPDVDELASRPLAAVPVEVDTVGPVGTSGSPPEAMT